MAEPGLARFAVINLAECAVERLVAGEGGHELLFPLLHAVRCGDGDNVTPRRCARKCGEYQPETPIRSHPALPPPDVRHEHAGDNLFCALTDHRATR